MNNANGGGVDQSLDGADDGVGIISEETSALLISATEELESLCRQTEKELQTLPTGPFTFPTFEELTLPTLEPPEEVLEFCNVYGGRKPLYPSTHPDDTETAADPGVAFPSTSIGFDPARGSLLSGAIADDIAEPAGSSNNLFDFGSASHAMQHNDISNNITSSSSNSSGAFPDLFSFGSGGGGGQGYDHNHGHGSPGLNRDYYDNKEEEEEEDKGEEEQLVFHFGETDTDEFVFAHENESEQRPEVPNHFLVDWAGLKAFTLSPDESWLIVFTSVGNSRVRVDLFATDSFNGCTLLAHEDGSIERNVVVPPNTMSCDGVRDVCWLTRQVSSADSQLLQSIVTVGWDTWVRVWSLQSLLAAVAIEEEQGDMKRDTHRVVASKRTFRIWATCSLSEGRFLLVGDGGHFEMMEWFPHVSGDLTVASLQHVHTYEKVHDTVLRCVCTSPDEQYALVGTESLPESSACGVQVWDLQSKTCQRFLEGHTGGYVFQVLFLDNERALSGGWDGSICEWNITNGTRLHTLQTGVYGVSSMCLLGDPQYLALGGMDGRVRQHNLTKDYALVRDLQTSRCQNHYVSCMLSCSRLEPDLLCLLSSGQLLRWHMPLQAERLLDLIEAGALRHTLFLTRSLLPLMKLILDWLTVYPPRVELRLSARHWRATTSTG